MSEMRRVAGGGLMGLVCAGAGLLALGCTTRTEVDHGSDSSLATLMIDGDPSAIVPSALNQPPAPTAPPRFCPNDDCTQVPLAYWSFDDCNTLSTELADTAGSSEISHPAFRAVSVACIAGIDQGAVQLEGSDDIVYSPDQPDFLFNQGVTVAAWIKPDRNTSTQSIIRKRLDGSSAFVLAIDSRKITFALQLTNGRLVSVAAPIAAGKYTHVAATYDGRTAILYLNGAAAASTTAKGTLAAGVGPIFVGNDANGRQFKGIIDDVWLNTLAAPASVVQGLTCLRQPPVVSLSPAEAPPTPAGIAVPFVLSVKNPSSASCATGSYEFFASSLPFPLQADQTFGELAVAPGTTAQTTINVTASDVGATGPLTFQYTVADETNFNLQATASATMVVTTPPPPSRSGCLAKSPATVAPGGYYVNGNTVCTSDGRAHLFHGVDRPSLEWNPAGENLSRGDFALMGSWNANVVRIALNQDFWLPGSSLYDASYSFTVDTAIAWAEMAGMDVILDLHWSDQGVLGSCQPAAGCQQLMPDANSQTFWSEVAARYMNDGRVIFELYNEPHDVSWSVWNAGGDTGAGWQAVGMQTLYNTVRATGANNLVLIGGLNWAYDLSGVPANRIQGYNIMYATHPYGTPDGFTRPPSDWNRAWGSLTATDPVVATEFGVLNDTACTTAYDSQVIQYADAHFAGWTAWAWFPGGCTFPAIINDWNGTPAPTGSVVKPALLGYQDPPASPPLAGSGPDFGFTFARGTDGWVLNDFDNTSEQNLGFAPPDGGTAPTLVANAADGSPTPGALQLTVGFTALDQYVSPMIELAAPGVDLAGKTLKAQVRLVSGSFPLGGVQFYAQTGSSFVFAGNFFSASQFPVGQWVPLTLDLTSVTVSGFDPTEVVQIGVQIFSGFSSGGGTFTPSGNAVFEIDTVTD
jgi:endoglucanase